MTVSRYFRWFYAVALASALLIAYIATATIFVYRGMDSYVNVEKPVVWFEDPLYPNVYVALYDYKTRANVEVYANNVGSRLLNRTGYWFDLRNESVVYEYFEPWGSGCSYEVTPDGTSIRVVGNPGGGLYGGCTLRYKYRVEVVNLTATFTMKTDDTSPDDGIRGAVLVNSTTGYYYMAGLKNNKTGWFFGVYKYTGTTIKEPGGPVLPALWDVLIMDQVPGVWFTITVSYTVYPNGTVAVSARLYNATGGGYLVSSFTVMDPNPIPGLDTFGVAVYQIRGRSSAVFQMVGFTKDTYVVVLRGLTYCCDVYVYDSAGSLVGYGHVNEAGSVEIQLENAVLVNATVRVVCGDLAYEIPLETLLGGDVVEIYFYFVGPVLSIYTNTTSSFTGWLRLIQVSCDGRIYYVNLGLVNRTHASLVNITVVQVNDYIAVLQPETELMHFTPELYTWTGNVTLITEMYFNTTCYLKLIYYYNFTSGIVGALHFNMAIKAR
ncbi:MAG: hypothetical protein QXE63_04665 [Zestosphaera sp.]